MYTLKTLGLLILTLPLLLPSTTPAQAIKRLNPPGEPPAVVELRKELRISQAKLELLRKENDRLRKEIQALKADGAKPARNAAGDNPPAENHPTALVPALAPTYPLVKHQDVEYQIKSTERRGDHWVMNVMATSRLGPKPIRLPQGTAYAKDGSSYNISRPLLEQGKGRMSLPQDVPVELHLNMGAVPNSVHDFARIEFTPDMQSRSPLIFNNVHLD